MTEREAFEAEERRRSPGVSLVRFGQSTGSMHDSYPYIDPIVHARWEGWQAAAARYGPVVEAARAFTDAIDVWNNSEPSLGGNPDRVAVGKAEHALRQALAALDGAHE